MSSADGYLLTDEQAAEIARQIDYCHTTYPVACQAAIDGARRVEQTRCRESLSVVESAHNWPLMAAAGAAGVVVGILTAAALVAAMGR